MAQERSEQIQIWTEQLARGQLSRRTFIQRMLVVGVSLSATLALVEACAQGQSSTSTGGGTPRRGGTIQIGYTEEIPSLDPHTTPETAGHRFFNLVYSNVVRLNPKDLSAVPDLAQSWDVSADGLTWTFHLRPNIKFSNGDAFSSADVKATFDRILNPKIPGVEASFLGMTKSVTATDPQTVVFNLSTPNPALLIYLAEPNASVVSAKLIQSGADLSKIENAIGTGPWKVDQWVPHQFMQLSRNPHFYESGKPYIDNVKVNIIPNADSLIAAMRTKSIDFTFTTEARVGKIAEGASGVNVQKTSDLGYYTLSINCSRDPFTHKDVRQAISYGIDRQAIIAAASVGEGAPCGPLGGLSHYAVDVTKYAPYKRDVAKAKSLLAQAGVPSGFTFTLLTQTSIPDNAPQISQVVQSNLQDIGLNAKVELHEFPDWVQHWLKADYQVLPENNPTPPDPDGYLSRYFSSTGSLNFSPGHWHNDEMDKLLIQGRQTTDFAKRKQIYDRAQEILLDEFPFVWLYTSYIFSLTLSRVQGYVPSANTSNTMVGLRDAWLSS